MEVLVEVVETEIAGSSPKASSPSNKGARSAAAGASDAPVPAVPPSIPCEPQQSNPNSLIPLHCASGKVREVRAFELIRSAVLETRDSYCGQQGPCEALPTLI